MIYTNYFEKLMGNKTKIAMLRIFSRIPEKVWTSRDLARVIKTYNTTVLDNLGDLQEMGVINVGFHGHVKTIKVNQDSFVFKQIVRPLFEMETKTFDSLMEDLKSGINKKYLKLMILFGSIAEHKEKPNSDIDLIIIGNKKQFIEKEAGELQYKILKKYGNALSAFIFTPKEFREKQDTPFIREARKNHVILYGRWI